MFVCLIHLSDEVLVELADFDNNVCSSELCGIPSQQLELGIKTIKRLITGNVGKNGTINIDAFQKATI